MSQPYTSLYRSDDALLLVRINIYQVFQLNKVKKDIRGVHIRIGQ